MQAPFSPDTVLRQSDRISSGSTIRKDGSLHRKGGSHRRQGAVADRYSQPARRYSCFGRVVQLDRADGTNSPLFTREKACTYLKLPESNLQLTTEQCSAFFTYCIYYLHVKGLDKKTEKLRETQGLSELFSCVFYLAPLVSIMIFAFQRLFSYDVNLVMQFVVSTCIFCFLMGLIFYKRYKIACRNRIRMVLSIYDACTERENDFSSKNHLNYEIV